MAQDRLSPWQRAIVEKATKEGILKGTSEGRAAHYDNKTTQIIKLSGERVKKEEERLKKNRIEAQQRQEKFELGMLQDYKHAVETFGLERVLNARQAVQDILNRADNIISILEQINRSQ